MKCGTIAALRPVNGREIPILHTPAGRAGGRCGTTRTPLPRPSCVQSIWCDNRRFVCPPEAGHPEGQPVAALRFRPKKPRTPVCRARSVRQSDEGKLGPDWAGFRKTGWSLSSQGAKMDVRNLRARGRLLAHLAMLSLVLASGLYGLQYQSSVILPNNNSGVSWPSCIALNGEQRFAYAGGIYSDRLCRYNLATAATDVSVECKSCHNLTYDADRDQLYALAWEDGVLPKLYIYGPSLNPLVPPINLSVVPGITPWEKEVKVAIASAWNRLYCLYYDYAGAKLASVDLMNYQVTQIATLGRRLRTTDTQGSHSAEGASIALPACPTSLRL